MIAVRSLTKRFGRAGTKNAVDDLSFTIPEGKLFTLLGQSGCGKTTTLRMIAGIEEPSAGEIQLGDQVVYSSAKGLHVPVNKRPIGMVFQSYAIDRPAEIYGRCRIRAGAGDGKNSGRRMMTTAMFHRPTRTTVLAAITLAVGVTLLAAHGRADDFDTIKAAAIKEGTIVVWHNTPKQDTTDALAALFNKRFGMNIKVERVSVPGGQMTSRMMTEKRGGRFTVDVFIATDRHLPVMVKNGLIEKVDWVRLFAGPGKIDATLLQNATNHIIPEFVGYGLEFRHSVFGIAYNTKMLSEQEVPHTWEGLTDPKWKNKVIVDAGLSPLARLLPAIGRDGVLELAKKMVANRPIYSDGQPSSAKKVVSGEGPLSAITLSSALDERQKGAPIGLVYPEPQALISQQVLYVNKGAPHPNLAKLWAAWVVSEGMETPPMVNAGIIRAWPGSPGPFGEYFTKHNLEVRRAMSIKELVEANNIRKDLDAIAAGRAR